MPNLHSDPTDWWKTFFSGPWIDVQRAFKAGEATLLEVGFLADALEIDAGTEVLDVPCGTGRHAVPLASRGARVTGVDITETFLEDARNAAGQARNPIESSGGAIRFVHGDMRSLDFDAEFDAAYCMWGSFGFFDDEGQRRFLRGVARALRPGGRFLLDGHVAETMFPIWQKRGWWPLGDMKVIEERSWDPLAGRVDVEWTFVRNDEVSRRHSSIRIYTYRELVTALKEAGFRSLETYDDYQPAPFEIGANRLVAVARL